MLKLKLWMALPTQCIWVWVSSRSWWVTGKPGVLRPRGCKELDLTEWLNWTDLILCHPPSPPALNLSQHLGLFPMSQLSASGAQTIGVSPSASILLMNIQGWFPLGLTVWSPCCPRDPRESSPGPQFNGINSSALSLLYDSDFTSIHEYWKKHSFDYMDLCQKNEVSAS